MNDRMRRGSACRLLTLLLTLVLVIPAYGQETLDALAAAQGCTAETLLQSDKLTAGDSVSDWVAIAVSRAGTEGDTAAYRKALERYVTRMVPREQGGLDRLRATEWQRHRPDGAGAGGGPHRLRPGQERSVGEPAGRRRISIHRCQISGNTGTQRLDLRPDRSGQRPLRRAGGCRLHQSHYFAGAGGSAGAGGRLRPDGRELRRGSDSHDPAGAGALSEQHSDVYRNLRGVCDHPGGGAPGAGVAV